MRRTFALWTAPFLSFALSPYKNISSILAHCSEGTLVARDKSQVLKAEAVRVISLAI